MKKLNSTHAQSSIRQKQIIEAALACFTEKGFTETSIADICRKAGASTGSVYHHFQSKAGLAAAVYLEGIRDYQSGMTRKLSEQESARDGIHAIVYYHLNWVKKNPDWARFLFQKRHADFMGGIEAEMNQLNAEFAKAMSAWYQKCVEAGRLRIFPRDVLISLILGPCQEFSRIYISGYASSKVDDAARGIAKAVWASVGQGECKGNFIFTLP